jgi:hypothetical protein
MQSLGLLGLCALAPGAGFFSRDPFAVTEKSGDETGIYQIVEAGFQGYGTAVVAAANE